MPNNKHKQNVKLNVAKTVKTFHIHLNVQFCHCYGHCWNVLATTLEISSLWTENWYVGEENVLCHLGKVVWCRLVQRHRKWENHSWNNLWSCWVKRQKRIVVGECWICNGELSVQNERLCITHSEEEMVGEKGYS